MNIPQDITDFLVQVSNSKTGLSYKPDRPGCRTIENQAWRLCEKYSLYNGGAIVAERGEGWDGEPLEGLKVIKKKATYKGKEYECNEFEIHQYDEPRFYYDMPENLVVNISGRNYKVDIDINCSPHSEPIGATVHFIETDDAETKWEIWTEEGALAKRRAFEVLSLKECKEQAVNNPDGEDWDYFIELCEKNIARIDAGDMRFDPPYYLQVFGKPQFIQNEIFPGHNGKLAYHLATLNTEWGDSGNINIMFALDDDGRPCRAWWEASCC